ncbi:Hypothetical predicted protein, partial [Pelobates cultripes]
LKSLLGSLIPPTQPPPTLTWVEEICRAEKNPRRTFSKPSPAQRRNRGYNGQTRPGMARRPTH